MLYCNKFLQRCSAFAKMMSIKEENASVMQVSPIIVHQMGKVGSKTVELSLRKAYEDLDIHVPIYHTHVLNGFEAMKQFVVSKQNRQNAEGALAELSRGEFVRKLIDENPDQHWKIISLVRDPIARNTSAFFESLTEYMPDWRERYAQGSLTAYEIRALFLYSGTSREIAEDWFKWQMGLFPAFGIDVFASPFPREAGYKIYPGAAQADLLLIRLESLKACAEIAMQEFLGLKNFSLYNSNISDEKEYAPLYRAFNEIPLPTDYVEQMYKTRSAQHFYTDVELARFKERWLKTTEFSNNNFSTEKQLAEVEKAIQVMTIQMVEKTKSVTDLTAELEEIKVTKAWRLAKFLRRVQVSLFPPNSMRAKFMSWLVNLILLPFQRNDRSG